MLHLLSCLAFTVFIQGASHLAVCPSHCTIEMYLHFASGNKEKLLTIINSVVNLLSYHCLG